jgi:hypothetical protein
MKSEQECSSPNARCFSHLEKIESQSRLLEFSEVTPSKAKSTTEAIVETNKVLTSTVPEMKPFRRSVQWQDGKASQQQLNPARRADR